MKKFFGIALIAILGLFLVACNDVTTATPTTSGTTDTQQSTETTETTETTEAVDLTALVTALKAEYATTLEDATFLATEDLTLLETISGFAITWTSNNTDYLANDGTVTRPAFAVGDQTVALTASVTDGTVVESYTFFVAVKALDKSDQERADEVFLVVAAFPSKDFWTSADEETLEFVTTGDDKDGVSYTVSWTSSNPASLTVDGDITQSIDADVKVTMTASVTINDVEYTYDVEFTIAQIEAATNVATIAEALALDEGSYVNIQGVTVVGIDQTGDVFFTDGVDILYIYLTPFNAEVGDVLDISGELAYHYFTPQFISTDLHPVVAVASTADASTAPVTQAASVTDLIGMLDVPAANAPFSNTYYEVTAKIYYNAAWGNYSVFLVNTDYDFDAALPDGATQPTGDKMMIYYKSDDEVLSALHGKEVTLTVISIGWRSDKIVFYADFLGTPEDLDVVFANDTEAVAAALDTVTFPNEITASGSLMFPASYYGVGLTYTSDDAVLIDPTTGVVDLSTLTSLDSVKITVTATKGEATDTKEFDIQVGELPISTVADLLAADNDVMIQVQGVVYAIIQNGFFIEDETGVVFIYSDTDSFDYDLGDEVLLVGTVGEYKSAKQLTDIVEYPAALQTGQAYEQTPIEYVDGTTVMMPGYTYTITGRVAIETSGDYTNTYLYFNDTDKSQVYYKSPADAMTALEAFDGKLVTTTFIYYNTNPYLAFVGTTDDITEVVTTDAEKVAADVAAIEFGGNIFAATTINLPATGTNGSAITWVIKTDAGSNASIAEGVLTIVEPTAEAEVVITGTFVLNDVTVTEDVTFTLLNVTAVDLGDFEDQAIDSTVAISGVVYAVIQNGFFVEDATGQLFVFSYSATYVVGDEVELIGTVAEYNGSYQLADVIELTEALSTGNDVEMEAVMFEPGTTTLVPGQLYTVIGTVAIEGSHNNVFIYYSETEAFGVYYKSPEASIEALEALVGEMVAVQMIYYNDDTSFAYDGGTDGVGIVHNDLTAVNAMTDGTSWDIANGEMVYVKAIVAGVGDSGLYVQDANGVGLFLYHPDDEATLSIGDEVIFYGELGDYNDNRQLGYGADTIALVSTGNALVENELTADAIIAITETHSTDLIAIADLVYLGSDSGDYLFRVDGTTETITLKLEMTADNSWIGVVYVVDSTITETSTFFYSQANWDGKLVIELFESPLTEAQSQQADAALLPTELTLGADYVLPIPMFGSTFTVTSIAGDTTNLIDETTTPGTLLVTPAGSPVMGIVVTVTVSNGSEVDITVDITVDVMVALYSTGFETSDGFSASTSYTSGLVLNGWTAVDGTVSTTSGSADDMHLQMRDYSDGTPSYAEYTDGSTVITKVVFNAFTDTTGTQVLVQFSTDGTTWSTGTTVDLTSADATFSVNSDVIGSTYVRFTELITGDEDKQKFNLDDVVIY